MALFWEMGKERGFGMVLSIATSAQIEASRVIVKARHEKTPTSTFFSY